MAARRCLAITVALVLLDLVACSQRNHRYSDGEQVTLWVNKVGPFNNPQETYNYYYLPFCRSKPQTKAEHAWGGLGEVLQGNELINSQLQVKFKVPTVGKAVICSQTLNPHKAEVFQDAISRQYWYELFLDDLPIWGFVGEVRKDDKAAYIFTHKTFDISYNKDRIIMVNLTADNPVLVQSGAQLTFTYSVNWVPTRIPFHRRFERYLDYSFFEHKIHWFSIINSFMMVIFLTGLVAIILMRTLRKDYARYAKEDGDLESLERDLNEETGWKLVHGDVFRPPQSSSLLSTYVGVGVQIFGMLVITTVFALLGFLSPANRGGLMTAMVLMFVFMGLLAGYAAARLYKAFRGDQWKSMTLRTALMFPGVVFGMFFILDLLVWGQKSSGAVPFGTLVAICFLWFGVSVPLVFVGSYFGFKKPAPEDPVRTNKIPRQIPEQPWYMHPVFSCLVGGVLPFGAVFIELFFILTSVWLHQFYYLFGFLALVFIILCLTCAEITIVLCYFQLCSEDYHWWWRAYFTSGSAAVYLFAYSAFYFYSKLDISKFVPVLLYFIYMSVISYGFFCLCGTIGFYAAYWFVTKIYGAIKID